MQLEVGARSDVGKVRAHNEDSFLVGRQIWAVADGMGGQAAGEVASAIVTSQLRARDQGGALDQDDIVTLIATINEAILEHARLHPESQGLGSTVSGIATIEFGDVQHWGVFNVGDSRVYRYADDALVRETVDHNEAEELIEAGKLDPSEAENHPSRSILTRSLGSEPAPLPDVFVLPQDRDETFLICSDGLTSEVPDPLLERTLRDFPDPREAANRLIELALAHGARDNVTAVVVAVRSSGNTVSLDSVSDETTIPRPELQDIR